jgi:uncharacterized protein (DUF2141 family)
MQKVQSNLFLQIVILIFTLIFTRCANISQPTGGPKDTAPPKLKDSYPKNGELNYSSKTVELVFNEDINSQAVQDQLLITPFTENTYKVIQKRNKLILQFDKPFEINTTYTFNFRESIKDMTESNVSQNLSLSFSTGPFIDSNSIEGIVTNLLTDQPIENILIGLYPSTDTFPAKKNKPYYFAKTTKSGNYSIKNIKTGNFDIIAFDDKNKNILYNEDERLAFIKNINFDTSHHIKENLKLSKYFTTPPEIKSIKEYNKRIELRLKDAVEKYTLQSSTKKIIYSNLSKDGKVINIYKNFISGDSIPLNITLQDSVGNKSEEDIKVLFAPATKKEKEEGLQIQLDPKDAKLNPKIANITIHSNQPIISIDSTKIEFQEDTTVTKLSKGQLEKIDDFTYQIKKETKAKDSLFVLFKKGAIKSTDTISNDQKIRFEIKKEENYSILEIKIKTTYKNYIIQLVDKNYNVIESKKDIKNYIFNYVEPGSYSLRAIIDENNNGRWDNGNLIEVSKPEPIIYYKNKIELRANWEIRDLIFEF